MNKSKLILLGLFLSTSIGFAKYECHAPTGLKILGVDKGKTWLKFIDHSDGDHFSFYFRRLDKLDNPNDPNDDAHFPMPDVAPDVKDTKWRNGKSRVVPLDLSKLPLDSKYQLAISVIKKGEQQCTTEKEVIVYGDKSNELQDKYMPTNVQLLGVSKGKTWIKFIDNSNGDFFRILIDGKKNSKVSKDWKDTKSRNGKFRVLPLDLDKLKGSDGRYRNKLSIAVVKDGKIVAKTIELTVRNNSLTKFGNIPSDFNDDYYYSSDVIDRCITKTPEVNECILFNDYSMFATYIGEDGEFAYDESEAWHNYYNNVVYKYYLNNKEVSVSQEDFYHGPDGHDKTEIHFLFENLKPNKRYTARVEAHYRGSVISSKEFTFVNNLGETESQYNDD